MPDVIVDCKVLEVGDIVRRPVPGAEWLEVIATRGVREIRVRSLEQGDEFWMKSDSRAKWMVLSGACAEGRF